MNAQEFKQSASSDTNPPEGLTAELKSLWYTRAGAWEEAHNIAQDIQTPTGAWIHALLHLIEGDEGNAGYWFRQAGRPVRSTDETDQLWDDIVTELMA